LKPLFLRVLNGFEFITAYELVTKKRRRSSTAAPCR
jgi:hypothetical protein